MISTLLLITVFFPFLILLNDFVMHGRWCGPCKLLGPRLETIIGGKGEKVHLAKVDIDNVSDLALDYGVSETEYVYVYSTQLSVYSNSLLVM